MPPEDVSDRTILRDHTRGLAMAVLIAIPFFGLALFSLAIGKHLDHDEHQFVAPGALLARHGLLPYRDYPFFHLPYLVFLYAALYRVTSHLLLAARVVSVACGTATLTIVLAVAYRSFARRGRGAAWAAGLAAGGALLANPVFISTSGRAWNHDLPTMLLLLATLALWRGLEGSRGRWVVAAGAMLGLAIGTRLTFAPTWLAFAVAARRGGRASGTGGIRPVILMSLGCAAALLPVGAMMWAWPRAFLFGNFRYPALNTAVHRLGGFPRAMTPCGKVAYVFKDLLIFPGNLALAAACTACLVGLWRDRRIQPHPNRERVLTLACIIGTLLIGSFAPTPLFPMYFFEPLPFAVLLVVLVASDRRKTARESAPVIRGLALAAAIAVIPGLPELRYLARLRRPDDWTPVRVHEEGCLLARRCAGAEGPAAGDARVLTYAPIFPLEGGCATYPEFATGPFAARVAGLVSRSERPALREIAANDLVALLRRRPPAAVLVGAENALDVPLINWAQQHGLSEAPLETACDLADSPVHYRLWVHRRGPPRPVRAEARVAGQRTPRRRDPANRTPMSFVWLAVRRVSRQLSLLLAQTEERNHAVPLGRATAQRR